MTRRIPKGIWLGALAAVLITALAVPALAASTPGEQAVGEPSGGGEVAGWQASCEDRAGLRLEKRAAFAEDVAAELGVTGEEVEQAVRTVVADRLDEAVAEGHITAERSEEIQARYDDGTLRCARLGRLARHLHHLPVLEP